VWGASQQPNPVIHRTGEKLERGVVIVLKEKAHFYYASGVEFRVKIPFLIYGVWPLASGGVLFQRAPEVREQRARRDRHMPRPSLLDRTVLDDIDTDAPASLPILYAITERFGDLSAVHEASLAGGLYDPPSIIPGTLNATCDISQTILFVSPDPYPFVVMYDRSERKVIFYRRAIVPLEKEKDEPLPPHKVILNPEDLFRQAATSTAPQRRGGRASLPRGPGRASLAPSAADPLDRARRKSRLSTASFVADDEFDVGPFAQEAGPATRHRRGGASAAEARRSSASGLRMPSSGGDNRAGWEFPKSLGKLSEDLRETTMMQGLNTTVNRSEIVLDRIWEWEWRRPG